MISVDDALQLPSLESCKLLAGGGGLDRQIRYVTVMDTPDIGRWLRGNEFLLCNIYVIKDDIQSQVQLVSDCHDCNVAALGVKTKRFVDGLPQAMLEKAEELALPIIEIPDEYAWIDVIHPLLTHIINQQYERLLKASQLHHRFTDLALQGVGLGEITRVLGEVTGFPVVMTDESFSILHASPSHWNSENIRDLLGRMSRDIQGRGLSSDLGRNVVHISYDDRDLDGGLLASLIARGSDRYGWLICFHKGHEDVRPEDYMAMEYAATVAALDVMKSRAVDQVKRSFRNDFLYDLINGKMADEEAIRARALSLGWNLHSSYALMTMEVDELGPGASALETDSTRDSVFHSARRCALGINPSSMVLQIGGSVTIFLPAEVQQGDDLLPAARQLKSVIERSPRVKEVTAGIGRVYQGLSLIPRSYQEAQRALQLGRMVWGSGSVTHYDRLGIYRILLSSDAGELAAFLEEFLGPIMSESRAGDSPLLDTLDAFFQCDEDVSKAASLLFIHPNTVRYRLRKVEEVTGLSLASNQHKINLQMALKIYRYLRSGKEPRG